MRALAELKQEYMKKVSYLQSQPQSPSGSDISRSSASQGSPGSSIASSNSPSSSHQGPHSPGSDSNNSNNSPGSNSYRASPKVNLASDPNSVVQTGGSVSPMMYRSPGIVNSNLNVPNAMCSDSSSPYNNSPSECAMSISGESSPCTQSPDLRHQQHRVQQGPHIPHQGVQQNPSFPHSPSAPAWHQQPTVPHMGYQNSPPMGPGMQNWPQGGAGVSAMQSGPPYNEGGSPYMMASAASPPFVELPPVDVPGHAHEIDRSGSSSMLQGLFEQGRR